MSKTISQREARQLRKRVADLERILERQRFAYARDYPGGTNIANQTFDSSRELLPTTVRVARQLGHAVVVTDDGARLMFYALPHPKASP